MQTKPLTSGESPILWRFPYWLSGLLAALLIALYVAFGRAITFMVEQWNMDEFSHGYLIPFISAFLVWQRRNELQRIELRGSWTGVAVVLLGVGIAAVGRFSALFAVQHIALLVVIAGLVLSLGGMPAVRLFAMPLGILIFMVPLPNILLQSLSAELQLISSSVGVALIHLAGVSVFLDGNVIDLGSYKLEVAEACSGLRYLLPLMTLGFLMACFFRAEIWKRAVVFLSSIPITLLMNSLRIAIIGVTVDRWGISMAEGLLHQVQGWMMFMLSTGLLALEVIALTKIGRGERRPWREVFSLEFPAPLPRDLPRRARALPVALLAAGAVVLIFGIGTIVMPAQTLLVPSRDSFTSFPLELSGWHGQRQALDSVYLDTLKLDDYLLANYVHANNQPVNLYVAWYDSQSAGEATHSPKACLPGGGWHIDDLHQVSMADVLIDGRPLRVNRVLIQNDDEHELVYYWFQQRGRIITNEYLVKWYLLVDALLRHRTDGALVRLIVPIAPGQSANEADQMLRSFAAAVAPRLGSYVPG